MNIAIISVTEKGRILSQKIADIFGASHNVRRCCFEKNADADSEKFSDIYRLAAEIFTDYQALIFVCACGIAVRSIAPNVRSKACDPAVAVIDDCGKFVVPILSGHIGGANRIAEIISEKIGAVPVITTATDVGGRFSPDSFAMANDLIITDLNAAKEIAAAVLNGEMIGIKSDYPYKNFPCELTENMNCRTGICISSDENKKPFEITLKLIPKNIVIGIGCKKGTPFSTIENHVLNCFSAENIDIKRVCAAATADIKSSESGLLEFCEKYGLKLYTYTADELMKLQGDFARSEFVLAHTGTDNVCERSAVKCSVGPLIIRKSSGNGVTLAAAEKPVELDFERKIL